MKPLSELETRDPPTAVQRMLIEQEITMWKNTFYVAGVRLRVQKRIDGDVETQAAIIKDMERCTKALDALADELGALVGE